MHGFQLGVDVQAVLFSSAEHGSAPITLETNGATTAGQCVQDDIPCVDRDGEVLEIDFL